MLLFFSDQHDRRDVTRKDAILYREADIVTRHFNSLAGAFNWFSGEQKDMKKYSHDILD